MAKRSVTTRMARLVAVKGTDKYNEVLYELGNLRLDGIRGSENNWFNWLEGNVRLPVTLVTQTGNQVFVHTEQRNTFTFVLDNVDESGGVSHLLDKLAIVLGHQQDIAGVLRSDLTDGEKLAQVAAINDKLGLVVVKSVP